MGIKRKTLVLLDGNALVHRAYHGLPPLSDKNGEPVHAVYGFALTLLGVIEKFHPEYIAASFDLPGKTFRHEKFEAYKGTRAKAPDDLYEQFPKVKDLVRAFNIPIYEIAGFEADDCVGTLARQATETDAETDVIIVTGDSDAFQLITDRVKVFTMRKGVKDTVLYDEDAVFARYGLKPEQLRDYKGLRGDSSDNIPGVRGIGEKGAIALLQSFGSLEGVYDSLETMKGAVKKKLEDGRESAFLSKELGTIDTNAPLRLDLAACVTKDFDRDRLVAMFREFGFFSLLKRLLGVENETASLDGEAALKKKRAARGKTVQRLQTKEEIRAFIASLSPEESVSLALDFRDNGLFGTEFSGIAVFVSERSVFMSVTEETKALLKDFLLNESIRKTVYDAKTVLKQLHSAGLDARGIAFDVLLAAYVLDAGSKMELSTLAFSELGQSFEENPDASEQAIVIAELQKSLANKMQEMSREQNAAATVETLFRNIEMPLAPILAEMEETGIRLNGSVLSKLSQELTDDIAKLQRTIYDFAGREFNLNSPKQLAEILFEELQIPTGGIKKLKTGFSTASSELAKLRDEYAIVGNIEKYRELFKLKTTYLDVLPRLVDAQSRVHTKYHQALTTTGRLSSSDPNLQNIPARNQWGERIRSAFEAEKGFVLVGADYSQIELRVAAHLANDSVMIEAFRRGEDIHRATAALIHRLKPEEVTDELRRQAKVLNFGLMYGMGTFGLAQAAGIGHEEAEAFIRGYFEKFSGMARYLEETKIFAKEHGFAETQLGRRRPVADINSKNRQIASAAERMAINMPIQGLEADIVKLSMIAAHRLICEKFDGMARMLLQVHDELIFEVKEEIADDFAAAVKSTMESVYELRAPLTVEVFLGKNWGEI